MKRQIAQTKTFVFLMAALFWCLISAVPAQAAKNPSASGNGVITVEETYVNPLYRDVLSEDDLKKPQESQESGIATASDPDYATTISDAAATLRTGMKNREETVAIYYQTDAYASTLAEEISETAMTHTGNPTEGDYLKWQYGGWSASISRYTLSKVCYITFTYTITYYTTAAQESEMDSAVSTLLSGINVSGGSDYQKVKAIYDYICGNVTYDNDNLNDSSYTLKYTAYAALINKTAVCQGYALLFYRLALELGVDARLISGTGNGGAHGWNIVKIDGSYYNLDATWDTNYYSTSYEYFLKCNANFDDHARDTDYSSDTFNASYPMAASDYAVPASSANHTHAYVSTVITAATCTEAGVMTCTCSCNDSYTAAIPATGHSYGDGVITTEATCTATGIKTFTCSVCKTTCTETVSAKGHSYNDGIVTTAATCTATGIKTFTCSSCGDFYTEEISATGHSYKEEVTRAATCGSSGVKTSTCSGCGDSYTESIPATGNHSYNGGEVTKAATCTAAGVKTFTCSSCGDSYTKEIPATGHSYKEEVTAEATCGGDGVKTFTCSGCGSSYTEAIPATGRHSYDEGKVTTEATASSAGEKTYTCQGCGKTILEEIPKLSLAAPTLTFKKSGVTKAMGSKAFTNSLTKITDGKLTYASSNPKVAKVDASTGKVTLKGVGTARITVTAEAGANYAAGSASYTLKVNPSKTTLSSVKNVRAKKMTVKWKKNASGSGYKIQYSTSAKFTKKTTKTVTVKKNSTVSKTIAKLKKGKKYYVRIRAYKTVSGKTYYGAWSGKKSVKIKK